jgi:hypothetical protein
MFWRSRPDAAQVPHAARRAPTRHKGGLTAFLGLDDDDLAPLIGEGATV